MRLAPRCLVVACLTVAATVAAGPVFSAPMDARSPGPIRGPDAGAAAAHDGGTRSFYAADGQTLIVVEPSRRVAVRAVGGARVSVRTAGVVDAAVLHLGRGHRPRPHLVWIGRAGIGLAALDGAAAPPPLMLAMPGPGGAARAAAATRLAVTVDGAGGTVILVGSRRGWVTAVIVTEHYGSIRLKTVGHWPVVGAVRSLAAHEAGVRIASESGAWLLDLGKAEPSIVALTAVLGSNRD